jgi:hypothetical protein
MTAPQAWKRQRLIELGYGIPEWLRLVPVDFEVGQSWTSFAVRYFADRIDGLLADPLWRL